MKDAADVVVVVVDEHHPAPLDQLAHVPSLGLAEPKRQMAGEIDERVLEDRVRRERNDRARRRHRDRRVARDRIDDVRRK